MMRHLNKLWLSTASPAPVVDRIIPRPVGSMTTQRSANRKDDSMARHFGVLIPSTNTTVEMECRLLPLAYQAHVGRLMSNTPGQTFSPSRDDDVDYQSRLLGTAKVLMRDLIGDSLSALKRRRYFRGEFLDDLIARTRNCDLSGHHTAAWDLIVLELWLASRT